MTISTISDTPASIGNQPNQPEVGDVNLDANNVHFPDFNLTFRLTGVRVPKDGLKLWDFVNGLVNVSSVRVAFNGVSGPNKEAVTGAIKATLGTKEKGSEIASLSTEMKEAKVASAFDTPNKAFDGIDENIELWLGVSGGKGDYADVTGVVTIAGNFIGGGEDLLPVIPAQN